MAGRARPCPSCYGGAGLFSFGFVGSGVALAGRVRCGSV